LANCHDPIATALFVDGRQQIDRLFQRCSSLRRPLVDPGEAIGCHLVKCGMTLRFSLAVDHHFDVRKSVSVLLRCASVLRPGFCAVGAFVLLWTAGSPLRGQTPAEFDRLRRGMVAQFIEKEGVRNPRVLTAMRTVPRQEFMPAKFRAKAYTDAAWSIGYQQTISPPFVVAYMTEVLEPQPTDRVLEVGTGSGYQAAVLSGLVKEVYSIEIVAPLGTAAAARLARLGYTNVKTKVGDGYLGWAEYAPFDKIIVTCSPENVPKPLIQQLKEGGRMVIPLGERYHQDIYLLEKRQGKLLRKPLIPTLFVPMTGRSEQERLVKPDPLEPRINNGSFEFREADGQPSGWHYQRQLTLKQDHAPEGRFYAEFANEDAGRVAQALQGMAIDGRQLVALKFTLNVRADGIVDGPESYQKARLEVRYFDAERQPIGDAVGPPSWVGSFHWKSVSAMLPIPRNTSEAVVRIGLNGATGRLCVDNIRMTPVKRSRFSLQPDSRPSRLP
jgi:protein-L-isoaspartate(D-aspartate) O-methyltransferase